MRCRRLESLLAITAVIFLALPGPAASQSLSDAEIHARIDAILNSTDLPHDELYRLASSAEAAVLSRPEPRDQRLVAKACLGMGKMYYLVDRLEASIEKLDECVADTDNVQAVEEYFQLRALRAAMLLTVDRPAESLASLSELVAENHPNLSSRERLRLRVYYAGALAENGQTLAAHDQYQSALTDALDENEDIMAMAIANNYLVSLMEQEEFTLGQEVVNVIQPVIARAEKSVFVLSLKLHELQLESLLGDVAASVEHLRQFIKTDLVNNASLRGNGYEYLSDALRNLGRLDESLEAALISVELLSDLPLESIDARFGLAETYLAMQRPQEAMSQIQLVDGSSIRTTARVERWHRLSVQALLALGDTEAAQVRFQQLIDTRDNIRRLSNAQGKRYYEARLTAQRQQAELQRSRENEAALEAKADALAQRADALETLSKRSDQMRVVVIVTAVVLSIAAILLYYLYAQRRFERRLRAREEELNESLSRQIEEHAARSLAQLDEQNRLEQALAKTAHAEAISRLTGSVAHDFNNLMQVVRVANEHLEDESMSDMQRSFLKGSNDALQHAAAIIRQLLAFARRQTLEVEVITFSQLLEQSRPLFDAAIGRQVTLEIDDQSEGLSLRVDRSQLLSMLLNLLTNSCDAMPEGGRIHIRADKVTMRQPDGLWPDLPSGEYLQLRIADNGAGMTESTRQNAFEPFFTTKDDQTGTGLGLSSVKGFALQSGGDVQILETSATGTTIGMMLPMDHTGEVPVDTGRSAATRLDGLHILLVEDNASLASTLKSMMQHLGATVVEVASADDAVMVLRGGESPDAILSDIRMPGEFDGLALQQWVSETFPGIPVVLMTGYSDSDCQNASVTMINKPFSSEQLVAALRPTKALADAS
ncbi:MAG: ATP-binding protein [Pseudomonadota bacterium]